MLVQLEKGWLVHAATVLQRSASQQCTLETLELSQPHTEAYIYWIGKIHSKWIPLLWPKLADMPYLCFIFLGRVQNPGLVGGGDTILNPSLLGYTLNL